MKVRFIGTGTMGSILRCNTSVLVDDILFDIGMGTVKQLERLKCYTKNINYVVISHFHADHFLDIPNLLFGRRIREEKQNELVIIGPKGVREKVIDLMTFTHSDGDVNKYNNIEERENIKFIELNEQEEFANDRFKLKAFALKHGECVPVNGYILFKDGKRIAYACDTTVCDNYYNMCESSDVMLSDSTSIETTDMHMGIKEYGLLVKKYPNCKFIPIHRRDYDTTKYDYIEFLNDGEILEIC